MSSTENVETLVATGAAPHTLYSSFYRNYVLTILFLSASIGFLHVQLLAILMEPIRADLGFSDTQLGFLTGIAFAVVQLFAAIPMGRLADMGNRRLIVGASIAIWSTITSLTGYATSFASMAAARLSLAAGQSGMGPASYSLISDYFPPQRRATAISIFSIGGSAGIFVALMAGGWMNDVFGWRQTFLLMGLPGIALAVLFVLTVREPPREAHGTDATAEPHLPIGETLRTLWRIRSYRHFCLASGIGGMVGMATLTWNPAFFIRSHGLSVGEVGAYLAVVNGLMGGVGVLLGGILADRLAVRDVRWYAWLPSIAMAGSWPFYIAVYLMPSWQGAMALLLMPVLFGFFYVGPAGAMTQTLVPVRMRAMSAAIFMFVTTLISMGGGPQLAGILSDQMTPTYGAESLRYALLIMTIAFPWGALHLYLAAHSIGDDLRRMGEIA